jgi:Tfp pilus assembly protein PilF
MTDGLIAQAEQALAAGRYAAAQTLFEQAQLRDPSSMAARRGLAYALFQLNELAKAFDLLEDVIRQAPSDLLGRLLFGRLCLRLQNPDLAEKQFRRILKALPSSAPALAALIDVFLARNQPEEAKKLLKRLLALHRDSEVSLKAAAAVAEMVHDPLQALAHLDRLIQIAPDKAMNHYQRSRLLLKTGRFEEGWREYEYRTRCGVVQLPNLSSPRWAGEPVEHLLVVGEQGLGDCIQFARYIPPLRSRVGKVTVACQKPLRALFEHSLGVQTVDPGELQGFSHDAHLPLMSSPAVLANPDPAASCTAPYLRVDPGRRQNWADRLGPANGKIRIAVVYACSAVHPTEANPFTRRSFPARSLRMLIDQAVDCEFFSLQKERAGEAIDAQLPCTHLGEDLADLADAAAALDCMDRVISADTALAHLAGALGKSVALVLPFAAEWRWMLEPSRSPWYPSMTLFRQTRPGDWESALGAIGKWLALPCPVRDPDAR